MFDSKISLMFLNHQTIIIYSIIIIIIIQISEAKDFFQDVQSSKPSNVPYCYSFKQLSRNQVLKRSNLLMKFNFFKVK